MVWWTIQTNGTSYDMRTQSFKKVLITKSYVTDICCGYECVFEPLTHVVNCIDHEALINCMAADVLMVSSRNGVIALLDNVNMLREDSKNDTTDVLFAKTIYAVGEKTAQLLVETGFHNIAVVSQDMQEMLERISITTNTYSYISGYDTSLKYCHTTEHSTPFNSIRRYIFYRAVARTISHKTIRMILSNKITHVMLYSKRNAEIFFHHLITKQNLFLALQKITFICISNGVAQIVLEYFQDDMPTIKVAKKPNETSMIEALHSP